jgi:hypothetical protein
VQTTPRIDLLPVRETFRALRYRFRQNGRIIRRLTKKFRSKVPFPNAAGKMFEEFEGVVKVVDKFASNVGRKLLKGSTEEILATASSLQTSDNDTLAKVAYSALCSILRRLGSKEAYVSEAAAHKAFEKVNARAELRQSETAAALMLTLLDESVITFSPKSAEAGTQMTSPDSVAVFALLLWMQSDCDDPLSGDALFAACDLSAALRDDIENSVGRKDTAGIAALFEEFSPHV